jgi:hypothetical protein
MTPKCTGSMPKAVTTGRKIGVVMMISGLMSMKVPSTKRMMLIIRRMTSGFSEMVPMRSTVACATRR